MRTAVILCAGLARRMSGVRLPKPLIRVAGREILFRTIRLLQEVGIERFIFVVNPDNERALRNFVESLDIEGEFVLNKHPQRENGYSLYLVREVVDEPFVLTMGDHLYSEGFVERAMGGKGLIVDRLALYTDREEATKVLCEGGRVRDIGKSIEHFNAYDTGFFILDRSIFETAYRLEREREKLSMNDIVREAGLECTEVSGEFWTDIDTPADIERAKRELIRASVKGVGDGLVSRKLNRKFSLWVSEKLVDYVSPNQITWLVFVMGVFASVIALVSPALGGIILQLSSMMDGVDGEIARASMRATKFGGWLDSILDRYVDFVFLSALALTIEPSIEFLPWVLASLLGTLMVSYSTERFKSAYCEDAYSVIRTLRFLPGKRDERTFLIMLFCLLGWIKPLFVLLALVTNLRVLLTLWLVYRKKGHI